MVLPGTINPHARWSSEVMKIECPKTIDARPNASGRASKQRTGGRYRSELIVGVRCLARVVFGAQPCGTDGGDHGQELLERHLEIEKSALAENPAVVVEDLVGDHHRQTWQR